MSYQLGSDPGVNYYVHADEQYNVVAVTNASGAVIERYDYGDYGQPFIYDGAGSSITATAVGNVYLFTGRRYDAEIGWYHYRTRYLNPLTGRFTTRDTIGIWGDPINLGNGYTYVGNRPWSLLDPFGLEEMLPVDRRIRKGPSCIDCHNPYVLGVFGHTLPFPDQATRDLLEMRLAGWGATIEGAQKATPTMLLTGTGGVGNTWLDRNTDTIVKTAGAVGIAAGTAGVALYAWPYVVGFLAEPGTKLAITNLTRIFHRFLWLRA